MTIKYLTLKYLDSQVIIKKKNQLKRHILIYFELWKDWRQEEKGMTEDEIVGWHHWLNGHEFE